MTTVKDRVAPRHLGSTQIDVEIEVEAADGEEALEWVEVIKEGAQGAIDTHEEPNDGE
ncbi:hypothetical protein [Saliphagus sp. LR7]|uniref:hypothetical protein n=1 Tax=Saliphagus sp. LR7 TaxID=2282654 RepID=UPI0013009233|nr:hypothetical protein [Saliphagus sp. LR7]